MKPASFLRALIEQALVKGPDLSGLMSVDGKTACIHTVKISHFFL